MNTTTQSGPLEVRLSDQLGNEFAWLTARIDAEMAEYSDAAYADHGSARDQLERFAAEVMAPLWARIRELTLYAEKVEREREDARADALRWITKLNALHINARACRDEVKTLTSQLEAAKAEAETAYDVCGPMVGKCQACGHEHELPN